MRKGIQNFLNRFTFYRSWNQKRNLVTLQYIAIFAFICIALGFSFLLFYILNDVEKNKSIRQFNDASIERTAAIKKAMERYQNGLEAVQSLFNSVGIVNRASFDIFASDVIRRNPGIQALEWAPVIPAKDLDKYVNEARKAFPNFSITEFDNDKNPIPVKARDFYIPVYYLIPYAGNQKVFGFDLSSNAVRNEAINQSTITGSMVASSRITLVQEKAGQFGVIIFLPIYEKDSDPNTELERQKTIEGMVLGVFRVGDIVANALSTMTANNIGVIVKDISGAKDEQFLYYFSPTGLTSPPPHPDFSFTQNINVGGRIWSIQCITEFGDLKYSSQWVAWLVLLTSLIIVFLIAGYMILLVNRNEKVSDLVNLKTYELQKETIRVQQLNEELAQKTETFQKFFPWQFLEILNIQTESYIRLGVANTRQLTIGFLDIRNFTTISENLTPTEVFDMMNHHISKILPIIEENHGFIDQILGDGLLLIFLNPTAAIRASIALQHFMRQASLARETSDIQLQIGIGLNTGEVIAGTIGTENRMQTTVLGDIVNAAQRIESLNRVFGTSILISRETKAQVNDEEFLMRYLGSHVLKGKSKAVHIYEIIDALENEKRMKICLILNEFEKGIHYFYRKEYDKAVALLEKCRQMYPEDMATQYFLKEIWFRWKRPPSPKA